MIINDPKTEILSEPVMANQKLRIDAEAFTLINDKVKLQENREKVERCMTDILCAPNSIIDIDVNDITDLFQKGGEIHTIETSTDATQENRMKMLVEQIRKSANSYEPYSHILVYFFISESHPLLMEELQPFSEWIASVPRKLSVKWGMAVQSCQELRAIVLVQ
jgi:hypothetical protein